MSPRPGVGLLWILAAVSAALLVYETMTLVGSVWRPLLANPSALQTDFHYYYEAAQRFSADRSELYRAADDVIAGFAYPPPAIVPFLWLARLPLGAALVALNVASYLTLIGLLLVWFSHLRRHGWSGSPTTQALAMLIAIALAPVYMNAIFGQVNVFVLASAVLFATLCDRNAGAAGAALACGVWLKIYPALLAVTGLWHRPARRALMWSLVAASVVFVALLVVVPARSYSEYLDVLRSRGDKTAIHITNQSLVAFVERIGYAPSQFLNWTGEQAVTVAPSAQALNWIVVLSLTAFISHRAAHGRRAAASAAIIALIAIAAPLGWGHAYVMILPLLMLQLIAMTDAPPWRAVMIAACVAAFMIPAGRRMPAIEHAPAIVQNLFYSRYLFAALALILLPVQDIGRTTESNGFLPVDRPIQEA